jgi:hypothetical protein
MGKYGGHMTATPHSKLALSYYIHERTLFKSPTH